MKKKFATYFLAVIAVLFFSVIFCGNGFSILNDNKIKNYNLNNNDIIYNKNNDSKDTSGLAIKVYITKSKKVEEIPIEKYIIGVVCGEMPAAFDSEALKAQAVAARTYAAAHMEKYGGHPCSGYNGADLCDTVQCQVYMDKETRMASWPKDKADELWAKVSKAVNDTKGEVLTYDGKIIAEPYYFAVSPGKTENSENVFSQSIPYLKSVESFGDKEATKYSSKVTITNKDMVSKINSKYNNSINPAKALKDQINIISTTDAGNVKIIKLGNTSISGPVFRELFKLNSSDFTLKFNTDKVEISCIGYGHDVGMSQWGANGMAKDGKKYTEILKHYYTGVQIEKIIK